MSTLDPIDPQPRRRRYQGPERRVAKPWLPAVGLSLLVFVAIAFATLCPPELRPHLAGADEERFGAYFLLGGCMAFALPRRTSAVILVIALVAFGLEAGQLLVPGRDAALPDACVKAMGGVWGAFAARSSYSLRRTLSAHRRPRREPLSTTALLTPRA